MREKVFVSWNGGQNSYLAMLKAKESGLAVHCLLTFPEKHGHSVSPGVSEEILRSQAKAMGCRLERERVPWEHSEEGFIGAVEKLKKEGVTGGVFADINLPRHRRWVEKTCGDLGITAHFPLAGMEEKKVVEELLERGSQLLVVSLQEEGLSREWLGKIIDKKFVTACRMAGVSPGGERGEFNTLAVGGPLFKKQLALVQIGWRLEKKMYTLELCEDYEWVRQAR